MVRTSSPSRCARIVFLSEKYPSAENRWHTSALQHRNAAMRQHCCWTVDGQWSNVASRSQQAPPAPVSQGEQPMAEPARAKPKPTPETQHFWDGTQAGELRLQRCDACAKLA